MVIKIIKKQANKITAGILTIFILGMLIIAGGAQALMLNLEINGEDKVESGKTITFNAKVGLENEELPESLSFVISENEGSFQKTCTFDINGKMKSGSADECFGINIKKISPEELNDINYGYGYGYKGELVYEITLHTQKIVPGSFLTELVAYSSTDEIVVKGPSFTVTEKEKPNTGKKK